MRHVRELACSLATPQATGIRSALLIAAFALGTMSTTVFAQTLAPLALTSRTTPSPESSTGRDPNYLRRTAPAAVAGVGGAAALGFAGYLIAGKCPRRYVDQCEFHGWAEIGIGVLAGEIIGSAAGAAWPRGRGQCTGGQRFRRGLAGASLGALAGIGLFFVPPLTFGFVATIPVGSVVFMRRC